MDVEVKTLSGEGAGTVSLPDATFGLEPRADILHRVVRWQLARRQAGTHKTKSRGEINATGKKMYRQKGTGRARHSDKKATQFRGGAKPHGPRVRSHAHDLPKKVRALGLKHALSAKAREDQIVVLDSAAVDTMKTKALLEQFGRLGVSNALIIDGAVDENFARAARNIPLVDVLPVAGLNVYDIMRRDVLVLTRAALEGIEARFSGETNGANGASSEGRSVTGKEPATGDDVAALAAAPMAIASAAVAGAMEGATGPSGGDTAARGASEAEANEPPADTGAEGDR